MYTGSAGTNRRIPLWVKVAFSLFVSMVVPYYWVTYTPWNFLYFCDVALLMTVAGLWTEDALLISLPTIGIALAQMLWVVDFLCRLIAGVYLTGMTSYMFNANIPFSVRYDRRAFAIQSVLAIALLLACYFLAPAPPPSIEHPNWAVNINYVYGLDDSHPQTMMLPWQWLLFVMAFMIIALYVPTHLVLRRFCPEPVVQIAAAPASFAAT